MKQNNQKLLMLLPILPLMMANSPVKAPRYNYTDFNVTLVSEELIENTYNEMYKYTYRATNTGDGYIYEIARGQNEYYNYAIFYSGIEGCLFTNQVIGPGRTVEFYTQDYKLYNENVVYAANAYTNFSDSVDLTGSFKIRLEDEPMYYYENPTYGYFVDMRVLNLNENKYYYTFILNLKYKGENYSNVVYNFWDRNNNQGFYFSAREKLDLEELTLQDTPLTISQEIYPGYKDPSLNVMAMLISLGTVIGGAAIFCGIYFPIKARKKEEK